ncbi:hypothetical protein FEP76_04572 [Burkholderia multivorans]|nr:hypothetical protein [Burkholderia multivorans]
MALVRVFVAALRCSVPLRRGPAGARRIAALLRAGLLRSALACALAAVLRVAVRRARLRRFVRFHRVDRCGHRFARNDVGRARFVRVDGHAVRRRLAVRAATARRVFERRGFRVTRAMSRVRAARIAHGNRLGRSRLTRPRHERARLVVAADLEQPARLRFVEQVAERAEAVVRLVEIGLAALDRALQHGRPDLADVVALGRKRLERLDRERDRLGLARLHLRLARRLVRALRAAVARTLLFALGERALLFAHEIVVEDELIAVRDQQVGRRLLHADADHLLRVLAQFRHERRKIRVAADDHERIDMRFRVAEVERVDDEPDVGRILARLAHVRNLDQLEARLVHRRLEALVAIPVAIGFLHDDAALQQQLFEHGLDVEFLVLRVAYAERDVLEVAEHGHAHVVQG